MIARRGHAQDVRSSGGLGCLQGVAAILAARGDLAPATTLLAAAAAIRTTGAGLSPAEQVEADTVEAHCRAALPAEAFTRARREGAALDATAAADWALRVWEQTG